MVVAAIIYILGGLLWAHEYEHQFEKGDFLLVILACLWPLMFALQVAGEWAEKK